MTDQKTSHASGASRLSVKLAAANGQEFGDWFDDKTAEYQILGCTVTEAKEKAMADWHTYEAANV